MMVNSSYKVSLYPTSDTLTTVLISGGKENLQEMLGNLRIESAAIGLSKSKTIPICHLEINDDNI